MLPTLGIFGSGGFGRETLAFCPPLSSVGRTVFIVDDLSMSAPNVNGIDVISLQDFRKLPGEKLFNIAVASSTLRERVAGQLLAPDCSPANLVAKNATYHRLDDVGPGAILSVNTTVSPNVKIGKFFHLNYLSYVAHDCMVGDFVTFAPNVCLNGNCQVGDHSYLGTGAIVLPKVKIGARVTIGAGAVVNRDVPDGETWVGVPARSRATNPSTANGRPLENRPVSGTHP